MVVGTTLMKLAGTAYYSPQFNRGGNAATFYCDVLQLGSSPTLDIDVEHKNSEDTSWTTLASFTSITTTGVKNVDGSAIMEQLRFKYTVTGAQVYSSVHFNMLAPTWRPY